MCSDYIQVEKCGKGGIGKLLWVKELEGGLKVVCMYVRGCPFTPLLTPLFTPSLSLYYYYIHTYKYIIIDSIRN